jgi:hypothetical protein
LAPGSTPGCHVGFTPIDTSSHQVLLLDNTLSQNHICHAFNNAVQMIEKVFSQMGPAFI